MGHPYVNARAVACLGMAAKIAGMAVPHMQRRAEAVKEKIVHLGILRTTFAAPDHASKTTVQQNCPRPCISNMLKLFCNTSMISPADWVFVSPNHPCCEEARPDRSQARCALYMARAECKHMGSRLRLRQTAKSGLRTGGQGCLPSREPGVSTVFFNIRTCPWEGYVACPVTNPTL